VTAVDQQVAAPTPPVPERPRQVTALARRRAWGDIHVRFWWLSALAVTVVITYFTVGQVRSALRDRDIILKGIAVDATITKAGERDIRGHTAMRDVSQHVELYATMPDGKERTFSGTLPPGPGYLRVGDRMPIRVDRNDPAVWTHRTEVTPWSRDLIVSILFVPLIAILLAVGLLVRRKILRVWENGLPIEGRVVDLRHSAWAPMSRVVRYALVNSNDRRIFSAVVPKREAPTKGESLRLLMPSDGSTKPTILARLYYHG
jgi:hypothetical protein